MAGSEAWAAAGVTSFRALDAPLLIDSYALQARVLRSPMIGQMLGGLRPLGLAGIGVLPGPLRKPLGIIRPLRSPSDYAGLTIGTQQSPVADTTMRALGARPVWFGSEAPVAGLGGIEQQISQIQDGAVSPPTVTAKPWLRVSTSPSPHFLSSRCPPPAGALPR